MLVQQPQTFTSSGSELRLILWIMIYVNILAQHSLGKRIQNTKRIQNIGGIIMQKELTNWNKQT